MKIQSNGQLFLSWCSDPRLFKKVGDLCKLPQFDNYNVDPRLGTLGDFVEFMHQASDRQYEPYGDRWFRVNQMH
ncbi:MAG: hypothetical protein C6Y22_22485 [Hapalosiphonaceae cyanobacterium JJU2]|nr:MAG: hypothetical protein C6Y22_22485 [Hapalosiphonaceae cyanobacterium JJU2]